MKKLMIANSSGGGIAGTLDSSYYKGQGERQGIEREYVVVYGSDFDRDDINKEHNCGGGVSPTLTSRMGTGGNQVNAVLVKRNNENDLSKDNRSIDGK